MYVATLIKDKFEKIYRISVAKNTYNICLQ